MQATNGATNGAYNRFLKTLNVSDSPWACDGYNAGTIGHNSRTFEIACELAAAHGFDGFIMPNSIGFAYEAAAVAAAVKAGATELAEWGVKESLEAMALVETWRAQVHAVA